MLSAAAAALLSTPALAVGPTELKTVVTTAQATSATGDLTIDSGAGINFKSATVPMLTLDSNNIINNGGVLTGSGQTTETAVVIDATGLTGSFTTNGTIDLTGTGTGKTAIFLHGASTFTGNITLDTGSVIAVTGDTSSGILTDTGSILNGDLLLGGSLTMAPTSANESASSGVTIANLLGTIKGNVVVAAGSTYTATGNGAQGIVIAGPIMGCDTTVAACNPATEIGTFANSGSIAVAGIATRSTTSVNVDSGSALIVGNSVAGGILNNGPISAADTTNAPASIAGNGVNAGVIVITPETGVAMTIGVDTVDANGTFSFINRGTITATPEDPNKGTRAIVIGGALAAPITFNGGFFNSGIISASASSVSPGTPVSASALEIDSNVTLPEIHVSAQSFATGSNNGSIVAAIQGPLGGVASAIFIGGADFSAGTTSTSVKLITVEPGARIVASASVTDPTSVDVTSLAAVAIEDRSNSLVNIVNQGTISAQVTTLTNGVTAVAHAVDASFNTVGLNFQNTGLVNGDVLFGSGSDTYTVQGSGPSNGASHVGAINFGFSNTGGGSGADLLHVATFANVAGAITAQGTLDVLVDGTGTLTVQNVGSTLATRNFFVFGGTGTSAGTLNITVSQGVTTAAVISASQSVTLGSGANLAVDYGSFITTGGSFKLISAPTGALGISAADVARYNAQVGSGANLPFLFNSAGIQVVNDGAGHDVLQLAISTKTVAQLGLTGYGKALFPFANVAVAQDSPLGAAMIAGINSSSDAQAAYDAFAPDVSGGTRYLAISLTDQATGVVAARQRALRLFGKQPGDLTLWGNEFGEYVSTKTTVSSNAIDPGPLNGFKDHGFGFSLGMDEGSAAGGWYGAAFTFYTGDIAEGGDRVSKTSSLWYMLTAYSDWRGKGLFFDSQLTLGYGNLKGKRFVDLTIPGTTVSASTAFSREADSKRAALLASLGATLGVNLHSGGFSAIPQISLDGLTMREEGFTETGGGNGFDLAVTPYYANSLRVFLGSEFREDINVGDFYLQPSARLGYRYDLLNDPVKLRAAFADIAPNTTGNQPGNTFTIQGPDPSRGNYVAGLNLGATTENWTIGLSYDFVRGSNNATEQVGTISLLGRI